MPVRHDFIAGFRAAALMLMCMLCGQSQVHADDEKLASRVRDLVEQVVTAEFKVTITHRHSKVLRMKQDVVRTAIADPSIVEAVTHATREIEILGKEIGTTSMTLWIGDSAQPQLLGMQIHVVPDESPQHPRLMSLQEIEAHLNKLFPSRHVQLITVDNKVIVRGQARDEAEAAAMLAIVQQHSNTGTRGFPTSGTGNEFVVNSTSGLTSSTSFGVINMLTLPGEKQVLLKVRIAELKRSALRELGANLDLNVHELSFSSMLTPDGNLTGTGILNDASFRLVLDALETNGSAKILAEPNLVVLSGETASFLAGRQFGLPTTVSGVGAEMLLTPTVVDRDHIRLQVAPSLNPLSNDHPAVNAPGVETRTVSTTVELREGQVVAIAGLLQDQHRSETSRLAVLGKIPGLNSLTSRLSNHREDTELLILVTPQLAHQRGAEEVPLLLPGTNVSKANSVQSNDYFLHGIHGFSP